MIGAKRVVYLYKVGWTLRQIAREYNVTVVQVQKLLKKEGCVIRTAREGMDRVYSTKFKSQNSLADEEEHRCNVLTRKFRRVKIRRDYDGTVI